MTRLEAYTWGCRVLKRISPSARLDTEVLLTFVLKISPEELIIRPNISLNRGQQKKFLALIKKRATGIPIAYLTGNKEFNNLNFKVTPAVLIPRPTTEILVENIIDYCQNQLNLSILDIGTGSGAMAIALAKNLPQNKITASDKSSSALKIAKLNAKKQQVKIKFIHSDLLNKIPKKFQPDIICANLPYLSKDLKISVWQKKQLASEPPSALWAKNNGLDLYLKLFKQIKAKKWQPQLIIVEINPGQAKALIQVIKQSLPNYQIKKIADLTGFTRFLEIKKPTPSSSRYNHRASL